jgi:formylglycine-generating enzyme required for sulfatase activity
MRKVQILVFAFLGIIGNTIYCQTVKEISFRSMPGLALASIKLSDSLSVDNMASRPLFTFDADGRSFSSSVAETVKSQAGFVLSYQNGIRVSVDSLPGSKHGWSCKITFSNTGSDSIAISNVVPFGTDNTAAYITCKGPWDLARAYLFRPGYRPLRVVLPDNAWELGYSSFAAGQVSLAGLTRRISTSGQKKRYETLLPPETEVSYNLYTGVYKGEWQEGLRLMFAKRYLYDLEKFDDDLFKREDLSWIRNSYIIVLQMAWDREFFDRSTGKYTYADELRKWTQLFGKIDVFGIWPTWPRLGLDKRNQWDMYRDLPGGTVQLRTFARMSRQYGTRFFIAYNPWDNSTRKEDHFRGMANLIGETEADGVVLDTKGSSSYELQAAADSVRKGVVMFSEGMAVVKDMPGIIAGRVHNAIYFSPELNLNKFIKPDFSIFRVCDIGEDKNHREIAIAFFNGYGTELNLFRPGGRGEDYEKDLSFLASTTFILRQNSNAFNDINWTPLVPTVADNIFVNRWTSEEKTVYTVLSMVQQGFSGPLFEAETKPGYHFVSVWNHEELVSELVNGKNIIKAKCEGWLPSQSGTRGEGAIDCIARFPVIINAEIINDSLHVKYPGPGKLLVWKGNPSYSSKPINIKVNSDTVFRLRDILGYYEGKIVFQYLENEQIKDERIILAKGGKPWRTDKREKTKLAVSVPQEMILVPSSNINFTLTTDEDFILYPSKDLMITEKVDSFLIDKYPVTNAQYLDFITNSGYFPSDTVNYLRNWQNGTFRQGQDKYPVVWLSVEDMKAYADWAGKRLPSEAEWQLAAQGTDGRKWPWGNEFHAAWCNNSFGRPTPVDAFSKGLSPYGVADLVGNVWQMTADSYFNGSYYFRVIRGGSFYNPDSSWWYIKGGPQSLDRTQILLQVSQGFERSETVGFRCVKDIDPSKIKVRR